MSRRIVSAASIAGLCAVYFLLSGRSGIGQAPPASVRDEASVRSFGAMGDGATDDTAAFQRAVDSGTGSLRIPAGVYRLTKTVEVVLSKTGPISLSGDGAAKVIMAGAGMFGARSSAWGSKAMSNEQAKLKGVPIAPSSFV